MILGITGNIGSGKSTVAMMLKEKVGGIIVDADAIGHHLLETNPEIQHQIRMAFGTDVMDSQSRAIDRRRLSRIVFDNLENLTTLNRIFHPHMLFEIRLSISRGLNVFRHAIVDAALIVEWNFQSELDFLISVTASPAIRLQRLMERRRLLEEDAVRMMEAQPPDDFKNSVADMVIRNELDLAILDAE
ncbi:MAG: dephospho-CoA kinase, partial [Elusimicrobia bacterium RIFOXYB2_FULL_49_7]